MLDSDSRFTPTLAVALVGLNSSTTGCSLPLQGGSSAAQRPCPRCPDQQGQKGTESDSGPGSHSRSGSGRNPAPSLLLFLPLPRGQACPGDTESCIWGVHSVQWDRQALVMRARMVGAQALQGTPMSHLGARGRQGRSTKALPCILGTEQIPSCFLPLFNPHTCGWEFRSSRTALA